MKFQIGAMSVGDILDRGLKLLLARLPTFFVITLLVQLPLLLFQVLFPILVQKNQLAAALGGIMGVLLLTLVLSPIGTAAILYVIYQEFIDHRVGLGEAFQVGLARFGSLLLGSIMYGLVIFIGLALCLVPGLFFLSWYSLFTQVIVVENVGASESFNRSKDLSEGHRLRILGVMLLLWFLQILLGMAVGIVLQTLLPNVHEVQTQLGKVPQINTTNQIIQQIVSFPVTAVVTSFTSVCMTLLYFDLRIRKEGFDLEVAAQKQAFGDDSAPLE